MEHTIKYDRRRFLSVAALTFAAAELNGLGILKAQERKTDALFENGIHPRAMNTSFDKIKQVKAGVLDIGYAEVGPANGQAVILLHGWPYDIRSYAEVSSLLAKEGYRVIYLIYAVMEARAFFLINRPEMGSRRQLLPIL